MKNIDKVLLAINGECGSQTLTLKDCLDKVIKKSKISRNELSLYLNELEQRGYISLSGQRSEIYITDEGRKYIQ